MFIKRHIDLGSKLGKEPLPGPSEITDTKDQALGHAGAEGWAATTLLPLIAHKQPGWRQANAGLYAAALLNTLKYPASFLEF